MINIISQLGKHVNLLKNIQFMFHRKPRDPSVPTQSSILEPFNINYLHDNPGARYYSKRLGRGRASGKGYTIDNIEKPVVEVIRVTGPEQEAVLTFVLKEVRLPFRKDYLNMEKYAKRNYLLIQTPSLVLRLCES